MSLHKKPLTVTEETGLLVHMMGREIGKPSMAADLFRAGAKWGGMTDDERAFEIQKLLKHDMPIDEDQRNRLAKLLVVMGCDHDWEDIGNGQQQCTYPECQTLR